ncbi:MAG: hypothetical protein A3G25_18895 [Betaproteobacteria bacterium RIFCSPLOWO2_12_FULL_63_13]|nr:MAG: hypothetical protein A3H32_06320 [Betaproteobacteria bacterium RIFCSPLOWO2_02_FULL_63_19]OGA42708.1 MAG: hypothetical protein A3G25_18895 [Betaproteobacteria bacterium RIFCSPLOWO2_12_FULL_63_13]
MKEKLKSGEVLFKLALFFVFSCFYIGAMSYPLDSRQFPQLLSSIGLILTLIALAIDFIRKQVLEGEIGDVDDTELRVMDAETKRARRRRFYQAWAIILGATGIGFLGGFLFSTIFLLFGFGLLFGHRDHWVKNTIVAAALTVLVYFVFGSIMGVPLMDGVLW